MSDLALEQSIENAFPEIPLIWKTLGDLVQVQIKKAANKTKSGILLVDDVKETITNNTQIAKVVALGPLAYKNPNTLEEWAEGPWVKIGDYVQIPMYGGNRWYQQHNNEQITFAFFRAKELMGVLQDDVNPLEVITLKNLK
jgi:co-chaperonin GroES (HSP10)